MESNDRVGAFFTGKTSFDPTVCCAHWWRKGFGHPDPEIDIARLIPVEYRQWIQRIKKKGITGWFYKPIYLPLNHSKFSEITP